MWPQVPESINTLTASEARAFARAIRTEAANQLRAGVDEAGREVIDAQMAIRERLLAHAADQDRADALLGDDESDADPEVPAEEAADDDDETPADGDEGGEDEDLSTRPLATTFGAVTVAPAAPGTTLVRPAPLRTVPEYLFATSGIQGKTPGDPFESWAEVAAAAASRGSTLNPTSTERFEVARIRGNYPADRVLSEDVMLNAAKFEPELMAAFCPPATPYYNIGCANTLRRPVAGSLPGFAAPRGHVSIMPSPALSDITGGYGQWTSEDDADSEAVKVACQTIECGTPTDYEMYGIYRCLTVKNMMAMTYPELVEAYLNRLGAAFARYAEELLLNAMATSATTVAAPTLGYGGAVTITSTVMNYIALFQQQQRWDTVPTEAWLPRWVLWGMKMDIMRRRRTDGQISVPTDSQVESMFREAGLNVTWFIDHPTWAVAIPGLATGGTLNRLPASVQILVAPAGKYAMIDRGELAIGVTGNNIYRDNESNRRNQFTFFFENFEGVVDSGCGEAHVLDVPVCWNGAQIDDIVINCQGGDETGYQS
jgi:hypothetical protein